MLLLMQNQSSNIFFASFQLLVVQENNGQFKGIGLWKLPTGAVDEVSV